MFILVSWHEELMAHIFRQARSCIPYNYVQSIRHQSHNEINLSMLGELYRVVTQIAYDLGNSLAVRDDVLIGALDRTPKGKSANLGGLSYLSLHGLSKYHVLKLAHPDVH